MRRRCELFVQRPTFAKAQVHRIPHIDALVHFSQRRDVHFANVVPFVDQRKFFNNPFQGRVSDRLAFFVGRPSPRHAQVAARILLFARFSFSQALALATSRRRRADAPDLCHLLVPCVFVRKQDTDSELAEYFRRQLLVAQEFASNILQQ